MMTYNEFKELIQTSSQRISCAEYVDILYCHKPFEEFLNDFEFIWKIPSRDQECWPILKYKNSNIVYMNRK